MLWMNHQENLWWEQSMPVRVHTQVDAVHMVQFIDFSIINKMYQMNTFET